MGQEIVNATHSTLVHRDCFGRNARMAATSIFSRFWGDTLAIKAH